MFHVVRKGRKSHGHSQRRAPSWIPGSRVSFISLSNYRDIHQKLIRFIFREYILTRNITTAAPQPQLGVGVRQGNNLVTGELNVSPGTPLQMEIFLDNSSAPVYGILVTHMQVTDTKAQEETIIYNG